MYKYPDLTLNSFFCRILLLVNPWIRLGSLPEFSVEAAIGNVSSLTYKITFAVDDRESGL